MNLSAQDIAFTVIAVILFGLSGLFINRKLQEKRHSFRPQQFDYVPGTEPIFHEKLAARKLHPERIHVYGQSFLAHDAQKKRLFVQSRKHPECVLLRESEVLSFKLIQDGETIAEAHRVDATIVRPVPPVSGCSALTLYVSTNRKDTPEVRLPLITFTMDSADACASAYETAGDMIEALGEILKR